MVFEEKTIKSEIMYDGPIFKVRKHIVETRAGESVRDVVEHNGGSVMIALTDEGKVLMVRQYRKSFEESLLELPAGKTDPGEGPEVTAAREIREETGYTASSVEFLLTFYPTCGYSNEKINIFLCSGLIPGEMEWDETESLDVFEMDPDEVIGMIMRNEIKDAKTIIALLYARQAGIL